MNDNDNSGWDDLLDESESIVSPELHELQNMEKAPQQQQQERDLFIPIFTIVSVVGFFGAYAYESFRLYSRGELYLPWDN